MVSPGRRAARSFSNSGRFVLRAETPAPSCHRWVMERQCWAAEAVVESLLVLQGLDVTVSFDAQPGVAVDGNVTRLAF